MAAQQQPLGSLEAGWANQVESEYAATYNTISNKAMSVGCNAIDLSTA